MLEPEAPKEVYCICRSSDEHNMIMCDRCDEWYHYKCINLTPVSIATPIIICVAFSCFFSLFLSSFIILGHCHLHLSDLPHEFPNLGAFMKMFIFRLICIISSPFLLMHLFYFISTFSTSLPDINVFLKLYTSFSTIFDQFT